MDVYTKKTDDGKTLQITIINPTKKLREQFKELAEVEFNEKSAIINVQLTTF